MSFYYNFVICSLLVEVDGVAIPLMNQNLNECYIFLNVLIAINLVPGMLQIAF